ncbi:MAG: hypothetical protein EP329_20500 [Deltaproteobacteria bacterium]|nr:MAG: hypothetical protein EP329_20500 [Deltaproteobacteria bacterium]
MRACAKRPLCERPSRYALAALALAIVGLAGPAHAGFELAPLVSRASTGLDYDATALDTLVSDLGSAARPGVGGPSATVGALGFTFGYALAYTPISAEEPWELASRGDHANGLTTSQVFVRKGLPSSVELGASIAFFHDLDVQVASFEVKWAFVEGVSAPDIGARIHLGGVLGHPDLTVVTTGADLTIGKRFGLGGVVRFAPYAGYAFAFHHGVPRPIGVVLPGDVTVTTAILPASNLVTHRGLVGFELAFSYASFGLEASLGDTNTLTFRVGAAL